MHIQSIQSSNHFEGIKVVQPEKFSKSLLDTVQNHQSFELLSDAVKLATPDKELKCMLNLKAYNSKAKKECSQLVLYIADKFKILTGKIKVIETYEADNIEELEKLIKTVNVDLKG